LTHKIFLAATSQPKRIGGSVERTIQVNDKALSMKGGRFIIVGLFAFDPWGAWFVYIFLQIQECLRCKQAKII
jgi:hypothetical protein